jgi:hypothetical protein
MHLYKKSRYGANVKALLPDLKREKQQSFKNDMQHLPTFKASFLPNYNFYFRQMFLRFARLG